MGFSVRKSIKVGPLRFNLSTSGIGVSAGIPGFRAGTGPRGNYVHLGGRGLYYRTALPSGSQVHPAPSFVPLPNQASTHAPLQAIGSGAVSQMGDSSSASLLAELNEKNQRLRIFPLAVVATLIVVFVFLFLGIPLWIVIPATLFAAGGCLYAHQRDVLAKSVVIFYDFDSGMEAGYQRIHDCLLEFARCGGKWHIEARGAVYDPKYHAGADHLVSRNRFAIEFGEPPNVNTNIPIPLLFLGRKTICFFPERLLVFAPEGVGAVGYQDVRLDINSKRFIESDSVPRDAQVVDRTWQYVNKKGGPDRRFANNPELPICLYEEIWFNSPSGLNEMIQLSRIGLGQHLDATIQQMAAMVTTAAAATSRDP